MLSKEEIWAAICANEYRFIIDRIVSKLIYDNPPLDFTIKNVKEKEREAKKIYNQLTPAQIKASKEKIYREILENRKINILPLE